MDSLQYTELSDCLNRIAVALQVIAEDTESRREREGRELAARWWTLRNQSERANQVFRIADERVMQFLPGLGMEERRRCQDLEDRMIAAEDALAEFERAHPELAARMQAEVAR